uniref:Vacuolar protein sorting-associated protein 72 homolog n=1 Tax=Ciona savignyi TaxID=51511 RepID=H2YW53_CIOSA
MAASRESRRNAGNRMSKVLEGELDEDEFYKTTYGGFMEEEEDNDFSSGQEDSADEVDSDFDRSENDEVVSDEGDADKPKRRKKPGVSTKAYKEPAVKKTSKKDIPETQAAESQAPKPQDDKMEEDESNMTNADAAARRASMRKSSRHATAANSLLTSIRQKEREISDKKKKENTKKPMIGVRRLTQEELLAEAEKTERRNLKSLENYQRLEANRKKSQVKKRSFTVPTIKTYSTGMPLLDKPELDVESVDSPQSNEFTNQCKISRSFIIFSHDSTFEEYFPWKRKRIGPKLLCPVTKKVARYTDPLTKIPYYDAGAFKQIREAYHSAIQDLKNKGLIK